jgi:anti-anti-sigma regulatory factor
MEEIYPQSQSAAIGCKNSDSIYFTLPASMTIETAEALAAELKQLPLEGKTHLTLDASHVEHITTPGLQLIISLDKTLSAQGGMLTINGRRDPFIRAFKDTGLESVLSTSS